nr:response regulator transcription factor [Thiorhodovibrio winogradskyi]
MGAGRHAVTAQSPPRRPRVLLADDHLMVAEALKSLLAEAFDLVGVAEDGLALIEMAEQLRPDLIVADLTMPRLSGLDALARLRAAGNTTPMVILTMHRDASFARRALEAGASGYVLKHSAPAELTAALHAALAGKTYLTPQLVEAVAASMQASPQATDDPVAALTSRQREVLPLLAEGLAAKEIAARLGISARTVEFHKYQMMDTLGAHSNAELVRFAVKHRLIEL